MLSAKFQNQWLSSSKNLYRWVQFQTSGKYHKLHHFISQIQKQTSAITIQHLFYHITLKCYSNLSSVNFQFILKNITFLKRTNLDSSHEDLRKQNLAIFQSYLLAKLSSYGISGNGFTWFEYYIFKWKQHVFYDGHVSKASLVFRGVPQRYVFGPICFYSIWTTLITVYAILVLSGMLTIQ